MLGYCVELSPDNNDTLFVTMPDFPEVTTFGQTESDALTHAGLAVQEAVAARINNGENIPYPSERRLLTIFGDHFVKLPALIVLKIGFYQALRHSSLSRSDLARALGCRDEHIDDLLSLDHASPIDEIEAALEKIDASIDIAVRLGATSAPGSRSSREMKFWDGSKRREWFMARAIARKIELRPEILKDMSEAIERVWANDPSKVRSLRLWRPLVRLSPSEFVEVILSDTPEAQEARENFAPVFPLTQAERIQYLEEARHELAIP